MNDGCPEDVRFRESKVVRAVVITREVVVATADAGRRETNRVVRR